MIDAEDILENRENIVALIRNILKLNNNNAT